MPQGQRTVIRMIMLADLRLNCCLVPLILALVATAVVVLAVGAVQAQARAAQRQAHSDTLAGFARLPQRPPLSAWLMADPRWVCLAELRPQGDGLVLSASAGAPLPFALDDPPPAVIAAVAAPQTWDLPDGRLGVAVPVRGDRLATEAVLVGICPTTVPGVLADGLAPGLLGILITGLALAWYLVRRIYHPVRQLQGEVDAVLAGRPMPGVGSETAETATLRSSVIQLVTRYRDAVAEHDRHPPA